MKRFLLFTILLTVMGLSLSSQTMVFQEGFEGTPAVTSGGIPGWSVNTTFYQGGSQSYFSNCNTAGDSSVLITNAFSTLGSLVVNLKFSHICKVEFLDAAEIFVSNNNGSTWHKLTETEYRGTGNFNSTNGNKFTSGSYMLWDPGTPGAPLNTWWQEEEFDISAIAGNSSNVRIMFMLRDLNNGIQFDSWGWLLDDITVTVPPAQEASLESVLLPLSLPSGCGLEDEVIQFRIANNGGQAISANLTATFQREGQMPVTEPVTGTIFPGDTLLYTFNSKVDLFTLQDTSYNLKAWITLLNDPNQNNDTLDRVFDSKIALFSPLISDTVIPYGSSVTLTAIHTDSITWYSDPLAQNTLHKGASFTTPVLYDSALYYVQAGIPGYQSNYVGPPNPSIGTISSSTLTNHFMIFDVLNPNGITLEAFDMYPTASAIGSPFTIIVQNSAQQQIASYSGVTTTSGGNLQTVIANLDVPFGTGFRLGFSVNPGFNRNTTGAVYPYTVPGEISITGNTFNVVYAYYFYNWKVTSGGGNTGCPSKVIPVNVTISGMPQQDAGVIAVTPAGSITSGTPYPVDVTIQNFGLNTLTKATINYSIGGVLQTPYLWTGSLPKNGTSGPITVGTHTFASGVSQIVAWTSMPNDSVDWATHNDTTISTVYSCLSGTITLGGAGADFNDIDELNLVAGLVGFCGPTIIEVNPGIYTGPVTLSGAAGLNSSNPLIIRSATMNAADVTIEYAATTTTDNFVMKFDGATHVTVEYITLRATGASYGRVVEFANGSSNNVMRGNVIESVIGATSSNWSGIYSTSNTPSDYNLFEDNRIIGGYYGVYWYGSSTNRKMGSTFRNNSFEGYYYYGLYTYYTDSTVVTGNTFSNATNSGTAYHIYYYYNQGHGLIEKNRIFGSNTGTFYGITLGQSTVGSQQQPLQVVNNYVYQSAGTGTAYGIYLTTNNNNVKIYHNSVHLTGGSATAGRSLYTTGGTGIIDIVNNIFHNSNGGYAYYINTIAQVGVSDYNNLFSTGTNVGYWSAARATLAALQTASGKDLNSKSVDPNFLLPMQPYLMNTTLDGAATPLATVTDDIDGNPRDLSNPDIGAVEFTIVPNDAGILSLVSPLAPCPNDSSNVIVRLFNFGTSPLTSCNIHWSVNGVSQPVVPFTGNLAPTSGANIDLGKFFYASGISYDILAYTTLPNGVTDMNTSNDTLLIPGKQTALPAGIYTIGGAGADFPGIDTVVQLLNTIGICGPVTFNINNGTYTANMLLSGVQGVSSQNTIIFQSTSGDSSLVTIQFAATSAANNYVVKLDGTSFVTFRNLTLKATGASNGRVVELANGAHYNTFEHCRLETSTTATATAFAGVYVTGVSNNYNVFRNNVIQGGYYGIYFYGTSSTNRGNNLVIENNRILSSYYYGINVAYYDSLTFNGNLVTSAPNSGTIYGARIYYCDFIEVAGNDIRIAGTSTHYGLYLYYNYGNALKRNLVANNFVSLNGTGTSTWYGTYFYYNQFTDFYHNSIHMTAGSSTAYTLYQTGGSSLNIVNNIFSNTGGGYAYYIGTPAAINVSNHNNFFATGSSLAYWSAARANLAALQTASGKDGNSLSVDPLFFSNTDLHVLNAMLNGAGTPLPSVPFDIDGDPRSTTNPDIGADEFISLGLIAGLLDFQTNFGGCGFDSTLISVRLLNMGVDTIDVTSNLILSFQVNQNTPVHEIFTGSIPSGDTALFTFSNYAQFPLLLPEDSVFNLSVSILMNNGIVVNNTLTTTVWNGYQPPAPTVNDTTIPYATSVTLHINSQDSILWYTSPSAQTPIHGGDSMTTPVLLVPTTYWVEGVGSGASGGAFIISEICHYKASPGVPVGGWPSYLLADDYIEITGAPGSDLAGFTLEQWDGSSMLSTHTFPAGTVMGPNGTAVIAVGQMGSSVPVPSSFYYHGNGSYTGTFGSTIVAGRVLKNPAGQIIDAVGYGNYTFPAAAGVTPADWSGNTPALSSSGNRLAGPYTKDATNWINSGVQPQDPNTLNQGVTIPTGAGCPSARVPVTVFLSGMPPYDLGICTIQMADGCVANEPLSIQIYNQGTDTLHTGGQAAFRIDNNPWIAPENINISIAPGDTVWYTFSTIPAINPPADTLFKVTARVWVNGDPNQLNDTLVKDSLKAFYTPPPPVVTNVTIPYATSTILTAQSQDSVFWWAGVADTVELAIGASFQTPILFGQTTYWVSARSGTGSAVPGPNYVPGPNIAPQATVNASNCSTGPCSAFNDLNLGVCGTQLVWVSTSNPPSSTPHDNFIDFEWPAAVTIDGLTIHHASSTTRFLTGAALYKWENNNWVYFHTFSNLPIQCENTFPFPTVTTTKLRLTSFEMNGPSQTSNPNFREIEVHAGQPAGCESPRVPLTVNVGNPPPIDAGVFTVINPVGSVPSGTNQNIDVTVRNYGTDTLTSFTLTYELNGLVKGSYNWTGTILPADTSLPITVYTDNFAGGVYNMRVWVSNANGTSQGVNSNDTISHTFSACLNGTYTLGGTSSDFATFAAAMAAIDQAGICGHVTFMVQPGLYTTQLTFNANNAINAGNTLTFQGATGDSTQVILQYAASGSSDNFVVKLNNASHITFKHMTIRATGGSNGYAVTLSGNASHNAFIGNVIQTQVATSSSFSGIYVTGSLASNNLIKGNRITGGYYGIYWYGPSSSSRGFKNHFIDNQIVDFYYYGANVAYVDSVVFNGNTIQSGSNAGTVYGSRLYYCDQIEVVGNKIAIAGTSTHYGMYLYYNAGSVANRNLVANNFVSLTGTGTSTWYGIYFYNQTNTDFYHNSLLNTGGSLTAGGAFYVSSGTGNNLVNNIFSNTGGGYAYYIATTAAISTSNFNNFYVTASNLAYWGSAVSTLAALKATSGKEANSLNVNPQFYSPSNLHVLSNQLNGAGTPLARVPYDIDGEPRDPMTPDIGADEFTPAQKDLGATALVTPVPFGCFGPNETVTVRIQNYGLDTLDFSVTPATITASASGVNPVTFTPVTVNTGTLIPGATLDVLITSNFNMSVNGVYTFNASATVTGDGNQINDAMAPVSMNVTAIIASFPYFEDFESSVTGSPGSLTNGWVANPASSSAYSWYVNSGTTSSSSTGPNGDHTTGTGKYVFTEASNGTTGAEAYLTSPCIDLSQFTNPVVKFWYHMYGSTMGNLYTQALDMNGNWVTLDSILGQQQTAQADPWLQRTVDLTGFTNHITRIRFKSVRSTNFYGDMAIDDIYINQPVQLDAGVKQIVAPVQNYANVGSTQKVEILVQNYGFDTLYTIPVAYRYNGGLIRRDTIYAVVPMDSTKLLEFVPQFSVLPGNRLLQTWTEMPGDTVNNNDTLSMMFMGLEVKPVPFCDDFDGANYWVGASELMQWEHGTPTASIINTTHSGTKVWATNLSGQYLDNSNDFLYSPYFDFSALSATDTASIEFWHWMDMQANSDYGQVQYSKDGGQTWATLGFYLDPYGTNWYNNSSGGVHFFSAVNTGWQKSSYKLLPSTFNQSSLVQFRFRFFSNATVSNYDGWAIDDFCISLPMQANDVGVSAINHPANDLPIGSQVFAEVTIKNFGSNTQSMFPIELLVNGNLVTSETWTGNLPSMGTTTYTFVLPYTVPSAGYQLCARTALSGDAIPSNDQLCKTLGVLPALNDVGVIEILAPLPDSIGEICFYDSLTHLWYKKDVIVRIKNFGQNIQTAIPVKYTFKNGGTVYGDIWTGSLLPDSTVDFALTTQFAPILGAQQVCVETDLSGDPVTTNNKSCRSYIGRTCIGVDDLEGNRITLLQNMPNPAGNTTIIGYNVPQAGKVTFGLVNMVGQMLNVERHEVVAGYHEIELDVNSLAAGVYYYFIEFNGQRLTRKMVVSR